jgi:hypothetical protein
MENQTPTVVIEQQGEKRRRGGLVWLLALAFVAVLAIGGTFAYLTYTTNQAANRIQTDPVLTADLLEPTWDAAVQTASAETDTAKQTKDASGSYFIPKAAYNMLPGSEVAKDPTIVNTSNGGAKMFAGMTLQFQVWDGATNGYVAMTAQQVADTLAVYGLSNATGTTTAGLTLGTNWTQIEDAAYGATATATVGDGAGAKKSVFVGADDNAETKGCMFFYYNTDALTAQATAITGDTKVDTVTGIDSTAKTTPLFSYVRFLDAATQAQIDQFNKTVIKSKSAFPNESDFLTTTGWRIVVKGAGIQSTDSSSNTAASYISKTDGLQWLELLKVSTVNTTYNDTAVGTDGSTAGTASTYTGTGKRDSQFVPTWSATKIDS